MTFVLTITMTAAPAFAADLPKLQKEYKISVQTACEGSAGTNANIEINLYNSDQSTGFVELDTTGRNDFERCTNKTYPRLFPDIGIPTHVGIKSDNTGAGPSWKLDDIGVDLGTNRTRTCEFYMWFDDSNANQEVKKKCFNY